MRKSHCLHCSGPLPKSARYCHRCGAQVIENRLGVPQALQDTAKALDLEAGFFKTMTDLFAMPGAVNRFYIDGGRKRYLNPLKYLAICFMAYQLALWLTGGDYFFVDFMEGYAESRHAGASLENLSSLSNYSTLLFLLLLPIAAFVSRVLFRPDELNFVEHLAVNAYLLAQVMVVNLALSLPLSWFEGGSIAYFIPLALSLLYAAYSQYRTFSYSLPGSLWRTSVFLVACAVLIVVVYSELADMAIS